MRYNQPSFNPADFWPTAAKAVASYIGKRYAGVFSAEDIEDIVGKVVCKMWAAAPTPSPFPTLDAVDAQAKRRGITGDIEKVGGGTYPLPIPNYAADDELLCDDKVEYYLHELKNERDKRFLLYLIDGLGYDEIAKRENLTASQVYMVVFRLRQRLKGLAG